VQFAVHIIPDYQHILMYLSSLMTEDLVSVLWT